MKNLKNIVATVALSLGVSTAALAQEVDYTAPHNFIGVQGGAQVTLTHYDLGKLVTPQFGIQFGRYFNDKVGARLHVMGYENKGGFKADRYNLPENLDYKFKAMTGDIDLLMNMTNIINPNRASHAFDWVVLTGFGVNYTWDYKEYDAIVSKMTANNYMYPENCGTKHAGFNGRLGMQFNYNISNSWALGLELQGNYKNDVYNLKINDKCDWQVAALLGLTYRLGKAKEKGPDLDAITRQREAEAAAAAQAEAEARAAAARAEAAAKAAAAKKAAAEAEARATAARLAAMPLNETIFFKIRETNPAGDPVLDKAAKWAKDHPNQSVTITGYADKGTGTKKVNKKYAEQRATAVADALKAKGVPADQLVVKSLGDTVQPYAENDQNRCTILVGE